MIIVIYLLMARKSLNLKPKKSAVGKLSLGNISADFNQAGRNSKGFVGIFMILVLTIMLFQMIKYTIFRYLMEKNNIK